MGSADFCLHEKILSSGLQFGMSVGLGFFLMQDLITPVLMVQMYVCLPKHSSNPFSF